MKTRISRRPAATGEAVATDRALAEALAGKRVLIAYGLVGELLAAMHRLGVDYMKSQTAWLRRDLGAEVAVVRLRTAAAVADNAQRIAEVLCQDTRPAVVIAHSKGGLETLTALMNRRAAGRCAGFHRHPVALFRLARGRFPDRRRAAARDRQGFATPAARGIGRGSA